MKNLLVLVGFIVNDNNKTIGIRLCDVLKQETSDVTLESFKQGVYRGVSIVNVYRDNNEIKIIGGNESYSVYNQDGRVLKIGKRIICQTDKGDWLDVLISGKVRKSLNSIGNDALIFANKNNKAESDVEFIKRKLSGTFDINKLRIHIDTENDGSDIHNNIKLGENHFRISGGIFRKFTVDNCRIRYLDKYCNIEIKTLLGTFLDQQESTLILLSDEVYKGNKNIKFKGISVGGLVKYTEFGFDDILYVKEPSKWYGNKELFRFGDGSMLDMKGIDESKDSIILMVHCKSSNTIFVVTQFKYDKSNSTLTDYEIPLDSNSNIPSGISILNSVLNNIRFNPIDIFDRHFIFDMFDEIDRRGCTDLINSINQNTCRLSDIDTIDNDLYSLDREKSKDQVSFYSIKSDRLLLLNRTGKSVSKVLYKNEMGEHSCIYIKNKKGDKNRKRDFNLYHIGIYSMLTKKELIALINKLESNKIYKDLPLGSYTSKIDGGYVYKSTPYTLVTDNYYASIVDGRLIEIAFNDEDSFITSVVERYKGIPGSCSAAYLIYRVVLNHDKSIPRCKEQLIFNGEIEAYLDKVILDSIVDESKDIVKVYVGRNKIEMKLSTAKDKLLQIYNKNNRKSMKDIKKKLDILEFAGGIKTIGDNIIIDDSLNGRIIKVPKGVSSIIIKSDLKTKIKRIEFTENTTIASSDGALVIDELDISKNATKILQQVLKTGVNFIFHKCNIHDLNIKGKLLYEVLLTVMYYNDRVINLYFNSMEKPIRSKEVKISTKHKSEDDVIKLIQNIHKTYDISLSDKNMEGLIEYIEEFYDRDTMKKITKSDDVNEIKIYLCIMTKLLESFNINKGYCNQIIDIVEQLD